MTKRITFRDMSKAQLEGIVADYAGVFPGWSAFRATAIYRDTFPIRQMIGFEAFRTIGGSPPYRVTCGIQSLVAPAAQQLYAAIRREPTLAGHASQWRSIVTTMEQEFRPDIRKRLDIAEVASLCGAQQLSDPENPNKTVMLATLHAFLGNREEARRQCIRLQTYDSPYMRPLPQWVLEFKAFGLSLLRAIEAGTETDFMAQSARAAANGPLLAPQV